MVDGSLEGILTVLRIDSTMICYWNHIQGLESERTTVKFCNALVSSLNAESTGDTVVTRGDWDESIMACYYGKITLRMYPTRWSDGGSNVLSSLVLQANRSKCWYSMTDTEKGDMLGDWSQRFVERSLVIPKPWWSDIHLGELASPSCLAQVQFSWCTRRTWPYDLLRQ
jgi:hypothetical protein